MVTFELIEKTPLFGAFSDLGKRIFLPDGIFYWAGRAKTEADINGTIGTAFGFEKDFIEGGSSDWLPCYLKEIKEYANVSMREMVPYAAIGGLAEIRKIWKDWLLTKSEFQGEKAKKLEKYITLPIITSGVTNGIFLSCALFLNPGEVILSPGKRWGNYDNTIVKFLGAKIQSFQFFKEGKLNIEGLKEAIEKIGQTQNKVVLILNFPNNPTGYVPTIHEAEELVELLKKSQAALKKPFIVIVDDAYEPYVFRDDVLNKSLFFELQQLDQNIIPIKLDGITKELLLYGGRIGFVTIGLKPSWVEDTNLEQLKEEINNKLEGMNRSTISNCNHFYQVVAQKIFTDKGKDEIIKSRNRVKELLRVRYEKMNSELATIEDPNISIDPNSGGFFLFLNINPNKVKAAEFADHLLKKYKVGIIPIEKPADNINGIRIAYCSIDLPKIPEFVSRIKSALLDF